MNDFLKRAYEGDSDIDSLLRRCAMEIDGTNDEELKHIYACAASQLLRVKRELDVNAPKEPK